MSMFGLRVNIARKEQHTRYTRRLDNQLTQFFLLNTEGFVTRKLGAPMDTSGSQHSTLN